MITFFVNLDHALGIKVTYHSLFICDFQLNQEDYKKILEKSVWSLCHFVKNLPKTLDEKLSVAMILRIVGNFIALENELLKEFIDLLAFQHETISSIIKGIMKIDSVYKNEILWILGNIYKANINYRDEIISALLMLE